MQTDFQFLAEIGAELLYTDTDSIVFIATEAQFALYSNKFIPEIKTFGGMVLEEVGKDALNIAPKKYAIGHEDGSYSWHANGIRARQNVGLDIRTISENALCGEVGTVRHFSITSLVNFQLCHTEEGESKQVRFLCLKGAIEGEYNDERKDLRIRWWKHKEEFEEFASCLRPIGFGKERAATQIPQIDTVNQISQGPTARCNEGNRSYVENEQAELPRASKAKQLMLASATAAGPPKPNPPSSLHSPAGRGG